MTSGFERVHFEVNLPSFKSVLVDCRWVENGQDEHLATGTAFIVQTSRCSYLVTNRHLVTGKHNDTSDYLGKHPVGPTHLDVRYHVPGSSPYALPPISSPLNALNTVIRRHPLYSGDGDPMWFEHPAGSAIDVVALELPWDEGVQLWPYDLDPQQMDTNGATPVFQPGSRLAIIGFPFGRSTSDVLPIWVHGFIASVPALDHDDLPRFLIDSRTRSGQSGSPVIFHNNAGAEDILGSDGDSYSGLLVPGMLVGIYSGRMSDESDLGYVWRRQVISELLQHADVLE